MNETTVELQTVREAQDWFSTKNIPMAYYKYQNKIFNSIFILLVFYLVSYSYLPKLNLNPYLDLQNPSKIILQLMLTIGIVDSLITAYIAVRYKIMFKRYRRRNVYNLYGKVSFYPSTSFFLPFVHRLLSIGFIFYLLSQSLLLYQR